MKNKTASLIDIVKLSDNPDLSKNILDIYVAWMKAKNIGIKRLWILAKW